MPGLKNWAVTLPNSYAAPEIRGRPTVFGQLTEDARGYPAGSKIVTSAIVKIDGRTLTTKSGSVYTLVGDPLPKWVEDMKDGKHEIDLNAPLKEEDWGQA